MMTRRSSTRLLLALALVSSCLGIPAVVLDTGKPKCFTYEGPQDMVLRVNYEAPDLITNQQDPDYTPVYITVNVVSSRRIMDTKLHMAPVKERLHPTSQMLEQTTGSITHKFEMDGEANVCFRAGAASTNKPLLIHWNAESTDHDPLQPKADVNQHLSHMEIELERIQKGMQIILKEADFSKEREALFHHNTLQMHAATTWWPMVQVCVLLATGFTQASHIVRFFKSRRII